MDSDNDENGQTLSASPDIATSNRKQRSKEIRDYRKSRLSTSWSMLKKDIDQSQKQKLLRGVSRSRQLSDSEGSDIVMNTFVDHEGTSRTLVDLDETLVARPISLGEAASCDTYNKSENSRLQYSDSFDEIEDLNRTFVVSTIDSSNNSRPVGEIDLSRNPVAMAREFVDGLRKSIRSYQSKSKQNGETDQLDLKVTDGTTKVSH